MDLLWVGIIIGLFTGAMLVAIPMSAMYSKRIDIIKEEQKKLGVSEQFEKIWDSANSKALEALVFKVNEYPLEEKTMNSDEGKKFLDEKREHYIEVMLTMKQLGV